MFNLSSSQTYHLYRKPCDMRKGFDGLCGLVRSQFNCDPTNGEVFVFLNQSRNLMKLLHWERGGFVLYYKRLERGTFSSPHQGTENSDLKWSDLVLMVEGIQLKNSRQKLRFAG